VSVRHRTKSLALGGNASYKRAWRGAFGTVKPCAKAIAQNVSVRTGKGSVDCVYGFPDQMKRGSK
jgi:hypothetical protein